MLISIENFKGIPSLNKLQISNLNFLCGLNGAGKSALTQFLYLLTQSLKNDNATDVLNKDVLKIDSWTDILHNKKKEGFGFTLDFERKELENSSYYDQGINKLRQLRVEVQLEIDREVLVVNTFKATILGEEKESYFRCIKQHSNSDIEYLISSNLGSQEFKGNAGYTGYTVIFSSIFPIFYEEPNPNGSVTQTVPIDVTSQIRNSIISFFDRVFYIGPERGCAYTCYQGPANSAFDEVGKDGAHTLSLLYHEGNKMVNDSETLQQAVNRWICDKLELAKEIQVVKRETNKYDTLITDRKGNNVSLEQSGYGVIQVLPIIVQGLLCPKGGLLIVDSAETHLHPSVQAKLTDFFIEMVTQGKKVIIETHSEYILTRIRRRIAEKKIKAEEVNIYYVSQEENESEYKSILLNDQGVILNGKSKGFFDTLEEDFKAIIKARKQL